MCGVIMDNWDCTCGKVCPIHPVYYPTTTTTLATYTCKGRHCAHDAACRSGWHVTNGA